MVIPDRPWSKGGEKDTTQKWEGGHVLEKKRGNGGKQRTGERKKGDGVSLIVICGSVILFGGIAKLLAWAGLAWGVYTLVQKED